ncbi:MAG: ABC transporter substrate-binding protein [Spirochaetota bacterium]
MKKIGFVLVTVMFVMGSFVIAFGGGAKQEAKIKGNVLNIWTWEGYTPDPVVKKFEEQTGIDVNISYYSDNGELIAKLRASRGKGADLVYPSVTLVRQAMDYDLYQPLDDSKINLENIDPKLLEGSEGLGGIIDGKRYAIPVVYGASGIMYNYEAIPEGVDSWCDLWNEKYAGKVTTRATLHPFIAAGLCLDLGNEMRDIYKNEETARPILDKVLAFLIEKKPLLKKFWTSRQENIELMTTGGCVIAMGWDGTGWYLQKQGYPIKWISPEEGALTWIDSITMPSGAENIENAYTWINFILEPENAGKIVELGGFMSTVKGALEYVPEEQAEMMAESYPPDANLWWYGEELSWWFDMMAEYIEKLKAA